MNQQRRPPRARRKGPDARAKPEKTAQTRCAIIGAALSELLERLRKHDDGSVAKRADVAKGTPYRYFPTRRRCSKASCARKSRRVGRHEPANRRRKNRSRRFCVARCSSPCTISNATVARRSPGLS